MKYYTPIHALVATAVVLALLASTVRGAVIGDARDKHEPSPEDAPHMARFITASRITYPSRERCEEELAQIKKGALTFVDAMQKQSDFNTRHRRTKESQYSGDLGLLSYDQLPTAVANVLFDVRVSVTRQPSDIIGPICTDDGCAIYVVFQRFRRSFFGQAWNDAESFLQERDMDFGQFLQALGSDDSRHMAGAIWPHDTPTFRRLKLKEVAADLARMQHDDPSTAMLYKPRSLDLSRHKKLMEDREAFFSALVDDALIAAHPEVFALELPAIATSGWISQDKIREAGFENLLTPPAAAAATPDPIVELAPDQPATNENDEF